ncbi:hypothetical protein DWY34_17500, partial [Blautia sp. AF25-12LB]
NPIILLFSLAINPNELVILLFSLAINPNELVSLRNPFKLSISKTILSSIKTSSINSVKSRLLCKMLYNVFTISTYQN